jgi:hypothetical protein
MGTDARSIKVSFYPVAEQYGYAAEKIQNKKGTSLGKWFGYVIGYVVIHIFLVPLILFLFGQYLLAGISIGISGIFFAAYSKFGKTNAYVEFYRQSFERDRELIEVELLEDGIRTSCDDCSSVYRWNSVVETQTTDNAIYFLTKDCGIAIPKTAFSSPDQITEFLGFAESKTMRQ